MLVEIGIEIVCPGEKWCMHKMLHPMSTVEPKIYVRQLTIRGQIVYCLEVLKDRAYLRFFNKKLLEIALNISLYTLSVTF